LARSASQRAKNVFPDPYSPRAALKHAPPPGHAVQLAVDGLLEALEPHHEHIETAAGHRAATEGVDDLLPALGADLLHDYSGDRLPARGT
jgi:hypothetical protein